MQKGCEKMFKKRITLLLVLLLVTGCSSNNIDSDLVKSAYYLKSDNSTDSYNSYVSDDSQKNIVTSEITIETYDLDDSITYIDSLIDEYSCIIKSKSESKYSSDYRYAYLTLYVPTDQYDKFTNQLKEKDNVVSSSYNSENITEQYNDTESRLLSLQAQEERIRELYSSAETVEDLIKIEERLSEISSEITQLQNQKNEYDLLTQYSTVYITLKEVTTYSKVQINFFDKLVNALKNSFNNFIATVQDVLVFIASNIFIIAIVVIVLVILKKKKVFSKIKFNKKKDDKL